MLLGAAVVYGLSVWATGRFRSVWSGWVSLLSSHSLDLLFQPVLSLLEIGVLAFESSDCVVQCGEEFFKLFDFRSEDFNSA